jgi:hypothetical protein
MSCDADGGVNSGSCPKDWPVVLLQQNTATTVNVQLKTDDGNNLVIPNTVSIVSPGTTTNSVDPDTVEAVTFDDAVSSNMAAYLYIKQYATDQQIVVINGQYLGTGLFEFAPTVANTSRAGIFLGTILIFDNTGEIRFSKNCYVEIEWNTTDTGTQNQPLSVADLRLSIRDNCPENNYLLDDYEFSDKELLHCIRKPVDMWNETVPPVGTYNYADFPFRHNWTEAAIGYLLKLAAHRYRRNSLTYDAGGVKVADQEKFQQYDAAGTERIQEYKQWMRDTKMAMNIEGGFGGFIGRWAL